MNILEIQETRSYCYLFVCQDISLSVKSIQIRMHLTKIWLCAVFIHGDYSHCILIYYNPFSHKRLLTT